MIYDIARATGALVVQTFLVAFAFAAVHLVMSGEAVGQSMFLKVWGAGIAGYLVVGSWPILIIPIGWLFSFPAKLGYKMGRRS